MTRGHLAEVARREALRPWHGAVGGKPSNLEPIVRRFPKWSVPEADGCWCAAFVYHCCMEAGFRFPYSPDECVSCSLAGCGAWEEFAQKEPRIAYLLPGACQPEPGDIVLYDRVFCNQEHDHIGIVLENLGDRLLTAEGNDGNVSTVRERLREGHIRAYIRLPDGFCYQKKPCD